MSTVVKTEDASGQTIISSVPSPVPTTTVNHVHLGQTANVTPVPEPVPKVSLPASVPAPVPTVAPVPAPRPVPAVSVAAPPPVPATPATPTAPAASRPTKSKKKKNQLTVTMATAATAQSSGPGTQGENTGRWTAEEHRLFLQGLEQHGKGWKKIASLIKSRTVVQIRTHAQKYFQKLQKARQNGEEGDVSMEGRGNAAALASTSTSAAQSNKRRRQTSGTKRKSIQSVVSSAQRQGKKMAIAQAASGVQYPNPPLPAVAPVLSHYVVPTPQILPPTNPAPSTSGSVAAISTAQGTVSGPALEDSLFRFLTPAPVAAPAEQPQVNEVARQAGANPITVPTDQPSAAQSSALGGEVSPTGVADLSAYPSWTDAKDTPSWYTKGSDVDALLDVADSLDWLTDSGDLEETYEAATAAASSLEESEAAALAQQHDHCQAAAAPSHTLSQSPSVNNMSLNTLPRVDSNVDDVVVPPLPSLFDGSMETEEPNRKLSLAQLAESPSAAAIDEHLQVFDTPLEEHDFVSTILETSGDSSASLPVLS